MFLILKFKWWTGKWELAGMTDGEEVAQGILEFEVAQALEMARDKIEFWASTSEEDGVVRVIDSRGNGHDVGLLAAFTLKRIDLPEDPTLFGLPRLDVVKTENVTVTDDDEDEQYRRFMLAAGGI